MDLNAWRQAQGAVIGSLLIDPEHVAGIVFSRASAEQFGDPSLRHVFEAALGIWQQRKPVDAVSVLAAAGGAYEPLIVESMQQTPTARNVELYLDLIRDAAKLSAIRTAALEITGAEELAQAAEAYEALGSRLRDLEGFEDRSLAETIGDYCQRMEDPTPPDYLSFGIEQLDKLLNVGRGKFVVLGADSSVGKTALALQFAWAMAAAGKKVGFFSLETDSAALTDRILAERQVAAVNLPRSKAKKLTDADWRAVTGAAMRPAAQNLRILTKFRTVEQIRSRVLMRGFDVAFIDYVQLLEAPGRERWDIVTNISIGLHRMAQELGVTVIGLSQITPASKDRKTAPTKDDLRESRQLKHDADVVLLMSISSQGTGILRELSVAKNKDGPLGRLLLDFDAVHMSFSYRPAGRAHEKDDGDEDGDRQMGFEELPDDEGGALPF